MQGSDISVATISRLLEQMEGGAHGGGGYGHYHYHYHLNILIIITLLSLLISHYYHYYCHLISRGLVTVPAVIFFTETAEGQASARATRYTHMLRTKFGSFLLSCLLIKSYAHYLNL